MIILILALLAAGLSARLIKILWSDWIWSLSTIGGMIVLVLISGAVAKNYQSNFGFSEGLIVGGVLLGIGSILPDLGKAFSAWIRQSKIISFLIILVIGIAIAGNPAIINHLAGQVVAIFILLFALQTLFGVNILKKKK